MSCQAARSEGGMYKPGGVATVHASCKSLKEKDLQRGALVSIERQSSGAWAVAAGRYQERGWRCETVGNS